MRGDGSGAGTLWRQHRHREGDDGRPEEEERGASSARAHHRAEGENGEDGPGVESAVEEAENRSPGLEIDGDPGGVDADLDETGDDSDAHEGGHEQGE